MYFLDTNICIYALRNADRKLIRNIMLFSPSRIKIPVIVKSELLYGAEKSTRRDQNMEKVMEFLEPYEIVPFDDDATDKHALLWAECEKKGTPVGAYDMIIAAITMSRNGALVTNNKAEFSRISGLNVVNWLK
jgi:tRNA(fMet)-specific endonuclease VapC